MRYFLFVIIILVMACKPYQDPDPISDPRLTTPYCNDPVGINYNWDFPGVPDNSVCFYASDLFAGNYLWRDTIRDASYKVLGFDSSFVTITKLDTARVKISGRCSTDLFLTADRYLQIVVDSIDGEGQIFCRMADTIIGSGQRIGYADSSGFTLNYEIISDTGSSIHQATFIKQ